MTIRIPRKPRSTKFVRFVASMVRLGTGSRVQIRPRVRGYAFEVNCFLTQLEKFAILAVLMNNRQDRPKLLQILAGEWKRTHKPRGPHKPEIPGWTPGPASNLVIPGNKVSGGRTVRETKTRRKITPTKTTMRKGDRVRVARVRIHTYWCALRKNHSGFCRLANGRTPYEQAR